MLQSRIMLNYALYVKDEVFFYTAIWNHVKLSYLHINYKLSLNEK